MPIELGNMATMATSGKFGVTYSRIVSIMTRGHWNGFYETPPDDIDYGIAYGVSEKLEPTDLAFGTKTIGTTATQLCCYGTSSVNTLYGKTSVTDVTAWDLSKAKEGHFVVTDGGFWGQIKTVDDANNRLYVHEWVWHGQHGLGQSNKFPDDGEKAFLFPAIIARQISIRPADASSNSVWLGFDSGLTANNGFWLLPDIGAFNRLVTIKAPKGQLLNITRIFVISLVSQDVDWSIGIESPVASGYSTPTEYDTVTAAESAMAITESVELEVDMGISESASISESVDLDIVVEVQDQFNISEEVSLESEDGHSPDEDSVSPTESMGIAESVSLIIATVDTVSLLATIQTEGGCANGIAVDPINFYLYVANTAGPLGDGVYIYDVSTPGSPVYLGIYESDGAPNHVVFIEEGYIALVDFDDISIIDVSDPTTPVLVEKMNVTGNPAWAHINGTLISASPSLSLIDVSDPESPSEEYNDLDTPSLLDYEGVDSWHDSSYAYVVSNNDSARLTILDISIPNAPSVVSETDFESIDSANRIDVYGNYAYIAGTAGLHIIDISDKENPALTATVSLKEAIEGTAVDVFQKSGNTYACVGTSEDDPWFIILDVTDPLNITWISEYEMPYNAYVDSTPGIIDIFVDEANEIVYAGQNWAAVHLFDISGL